MCESCWVNYGMPVVFNDDIDELAGLIKKLLEVDDSGGPLHPYLDDFDLGGQQITPIYGGLGAYHYSPDLRDLCDEIARRLTDMPAGWRASTVAHAHGWAVREHTLRDQADDLSDL